MAGVRDLTEEDAHQQATNRWLTTGITADLLNEGTLSTHDAQTLLMLLEDQSLYTHLASVIRYAPEITVLNPDPKTPTLFGSGFPCDLRHALDLVSGEVLRRVRAHQKERTMPLPA